MNADAQSQNLQGVAFMRGGDVAGAMQCFQRATELQPNHFEAWNNLGNAFRTQKIYDQAIAAYERALMVKNDYAEAHYNMANTLRDQRQTDRAVAAYRRAIQYRPDLVDAYNNLGNALIEGGQFEAAISAFEELLHLWPQFGKAYNNLGAALLRLGRREEAAGRFRQAIALDGGNVAAHRNLAAALQQPAAPSRATSFVDLGVALGKGDDLEGAAVYFRQAIGADPNFAEAYFNLGVALGDLHQFDEAIAAYRRAIELRPEYAEARHALALMQLQLGHFEKGWPDYEYRWKLPSDLKPYQHRQPQWRGQSLQGKDVLLHAEQGLGDTLQFARYIPMIAEQARQVYLICDPALYTLFSQWTKVTLLTDHSASIPRHDYHCAVTSLPLAFNTRLDSVPATVPYLMPDPARVEVWKRRFDQTKRFRVGLAWAGNPQHQKDRQRSIPLSCLASLARFGDVAFYSLQKGSAAGQCKDASGLKVVDVSEHLHDFADTAAAMACLDLVISVDTSIAHLAGALGVRIWTLLAFASDWRWLLDRNDSPWYPTMRLFRQRVAGNWNDPVAEVVAALADMRSPTASRSPWSA